MHVRVCESEGACSVQKSQVCVYVIVFVSEETACKDLPGFRTSALVWVF